MKKTLLLILLFSSLVGIGIASWIIHNHYEATTSELNSSVDEESFNLD